MSVNGKVVTELGSKANPNTDTIQLDGKTIMAQRQRYIMLNKPRGYITTVKDEKDRWTVMDLIDIKERVYPVGRLDRDTEGLLLLTNDGEVAHRVMHPRYHMDKEYHIVTPVQPTPQQLDLLREGVELEGKLVKPTDVRLHRGGSEGFALRIVLREGLYHVVRRMMEDAGIEIDRLTRVRIGPLSMAGIARGTWRDLTEGELSTLFEAVHLEQEQISGERVATMSKSTNASNPERPKRGARLSSKTQEAPPPQAQPTPPRTKPVVEGLVTIGDAPTSAAGDDAPAGPKRPRRFSPAYEQAFVPAPRKRASAKPSAAQPAGEKTEREDRPSAKRTGGPERPRYQGRGRNVSGGQEHTASRNNDVVRPGRRNRRKPTANEPASAEPTGEPKRDKRSDRDDRKG